MNNTNDGTEKIKAITLTANKAYYSLQTTFRSDSSTEIIKQPRF